MSEPNTSRTGTSRTGTSRTVASCRVASCRVILRRLVSTLNTTIANALQSRSVFFWCFVAQLFVCSLSALADARPGGGQSYKGGGSSSGGGSSGSSSGDSALAELIVYLVILCFKHPVIGIPLLLLVIAVLAYFKLKERFGKPSASGPSTVGAKTIKSRSSQLQSIRSFDPDFSTVLFEDFLYSLFAEVHRARGGGKLDRVSAYLAPSVSESLRQQTVAEVYGVIIGAMRITQVSGTSPSNSDTHVTVEFEANYTQKDSRGAVQGLYVKEQWRLVRSHKAKSRGPSQDNVLRCPCCGAPLDMVSAGRCAHCNQQVNTGTFDWTVQGIQVLSRDARGPMLTSVAPESGTSLPTIFDAGLKNASQSLAAKDPNLQWNAFTARIQMIFSEFQVAWSARDLRPMRPFLSDALFQTQSYWTEAYRQQHLRNITDRARITGIESVKITMDRYYDAITVRLWATSLEYTITEDGSRVVCGSKTKERAYSEYWTFIRGSRRASPTRTDKTCSNCGAPLQVNMAGYCEYCRAKVTSGEFDWVLSKIEQDESYGG